MDKLPSEIVHIIASLLDVHSLCHFRLVSKSLAAIGAAHLLPEVTFEAHEQELERLRAISEHPVLARHVRSLLYFGVRLRHPPGSFREFAREYRSQRTIGYATQMGYERAHANISRARFEEGYRKYVAVVENQYRVLAEQADVAVLREVLPRFTGLRQLTMSDVEKFHPQRLRRRKTPSEATVNMADLLSDRLNGDRQLEALLLANNESAKCEIESLRAGLLHWKFFDRSPVELKQLFGSPSKLKRLELIVSIEGQGGTPDISQFEDMMAKGGVRDALSSMADLETLVANFTCYVKQDFLGSKVVLNYLIQPGHRWRNLQHLVLAGVNCSRQELMSVLQLRKDTLQDLCLQDTDLKSTSWRELLPWIRNNMNLFNVCICGHVLGQSEGDGDGHEERWYFSSRIAGSRDMRSSVNMYCRGGGRCYPDELPLSDRVVQEYYDKWIAPEFPRV